MHCISFSVFGVPIVFDESNEEFIINDLLEQVSIDPPERANNFKISEQDFQAYIECARELKVNFDSHAEIMLRNYFIATKTIRRGEISDHILIINQISLISFFRYPHRKGLRCVEKDG